MNATPAALEVELKLILPGSDSETAIVDCLRQNGYLIEKTTPQKNTDIYMDTSDWLLLKNGLSLRYRLSNGDAMYTIKSLGTIKEGVARRMENEIKLERPPRAPTAIPVKQLRNQIREVIHDRTLLEQVLINTNRQRYLATAPEGAKFELAFDTSGFSADPLYKRRPAHLYQFEAELIEGPETAVGPLAKLLSENFGFLPARTSKLLTAMECLSIEPLSKKVPEHLKVTLDDPLDVALKKILSAELLWFQQQLPGAVSDRDPEFVHQARVTTRRMRSALILFHNALPEPTATYFEKCLKWLGGLFGAVRDLDVFIINLGNYKNTLEYLPKSKQKELKNLIVKRRRSPLKALNESLGSRRYKNFERRLSAFLEAPCSDCPTLPEGMRTIGQAAPALITQKFDNVVEQSRRTLSTPNPGLNDFHLLRIQMKRLRYTLEFMATPYGGELDSIIEKCVEVQDCLGALQDTVFNQKLIQSILDDWRGKLTDPDLIFILGEIYQLQGQIARQRRDTFSGIWKEFASEKTGKTLKRIFQEHQVSSN